MTYAIKEKEREKEGGAWGEKNREKKYAVNELLA